jgi:hypothetical protein
MLGRNTAVFGVYPAYTGLEGAVDALRSFGFRNTDVSFLMMAENVGSSDPGTSEAGNEKASKSPDAITAGASSAPGALGWLIGVGALTIPGIGAFLAAGPVVAAVAGAKGAGADGSLVGGLIGIGIPEHAARRCEAEVRNGRNLLSVQCDNSEWTKRAQEILIRTGAQDVSSTKEAKAELARTKKSIPRTDSLVKKRLSKHRHV